MAMSPQAKCRDWLNASSEGRMITPDQKNPKKHIIAAAYSMTYLGEESNWF